jgi:hypothetical protein
MYNGMSCSTSERNCQVGGKTIKRFYKEAPVRNKRRTDIDMNTMTY